MYEKMARGDPNTWENFFSLETGPSDSRVFIKRVVAKTIKSSLVLAAMVFYHRKSETVRSQKNLRLPADCKNAKAWCKMRD